MTKIIHLIRHGHHALLGTTLCGRMNGVDLDDLGRRQITRCCDAVRPPPMLIQSSPQRRTMHSAGILAERFGLAVEIVPALNEIDYGEWTGRSFVELEQDPRWLSWNARRETGRPPKGESMRTLQPGSLTISSSCAAIAAQTLLPSLVMLSPSARHCCTTLG